MPRPRILRLLTAATPAAFAVRALLGVTVLLVISLSPGFVEWVEVPLIRLNAWASWGLARAVGLDARLVRDLIVTGEFSVRIVSACTGVFVFFILLAAVLAFPAGWGSRLRAIALGGLLIFVLNQVRIVSLIAIGQSYPSLFEDAHHYVWQGVLVVVTAIYWYWWAGRSSPVVAGDAVAADPAAEA